MTVIFGKRYALHTHGLHESGANHRSMFDQCPHCEFKMPSMDWSMNAHTLIVEPLSFKNGCCATITTCPECRRDSWVHEPYHFIERTRAFPKEWRKAVAKHREALEAGALEAWGMSLCRTCKLLDEGCVDTHAWRACDIGIGPCLNQCDHYRK
jgi:hypothetical protein